MVNDFSMDDATQALEDWAESQLIAENLKYKKRKDKYSTLYFFQYLNALSKLTAIKPRTVSLSSSFAVSDENQAGFVNLVACIESGGDINPYQNKTTIQGNFLDGMYNDFGIKHFHLGAQQENGSDYIERTGEVALAIITDDEVFFIISKMHGIGFEDVWYEPDVLEILHSERPDLIEHSKVEYLEIKGDPTTVHEIKSFRDIGAIKPIILQDGTAYEPYNGGKSISGHPYEHTVLYTYNIRLIQKEADDILAPFKNDTSKTATLKVLKLAVDYNNRVTGVEFKLEVDDGK
ncbi:hypothetical protein NDN13_01195 [Acinetobacter sp. C32I]|uniref:hypothetical protein n=1 Tax=Acinetobacter sp. C32I TaxID=2950074 RepID=UPI0020368104|nr:hypothetical protein [Acinetobacter sp. C32I]USA53837.1 hypothetical protein NDN13_01195 [Acinetobacter sp. C32I]